MNRFIAPSSSHLLAFVCGLGLLAHAQAGTFTVTGQTAGPNVFIKKLNLTVTSPATLRSIAFQVVPKTGSATRPVFASYSPAYLQGRGYFNSATGAATIPVFGLYQNYNNTVNVVATFTDGTSQQTPVAIQTGAYSGSTSPGTYNNPTVIQPRLAGTNLSYDFILLKSYGSSDTPILIDTDGQVRGAGTAGIATQAVSFYQNGIYLSNGGSGVVRQELDGSFATVGNYSGSGVTYTGHHNIDYGRNGLIVDVNTNSETEGVDIEIDGKGNLLRTWDFGKILTAVIQAGGNANDQAMLSSFVNYGADWCHNNATTYRPSDNTLVVSSRENFVMGLDYDMAASTDAATQAKSLKWILGDPTKKWHQFVALQKYALALGPNTLAPIGQHAVSIYRDRLMLFDDGQNSQYQNPAGTERGYSACRKYVIDTANQVATEIWQYPPSLADTSVFSPFCSSVYEDGSNSYLIDYALGGNESYTEVFGIDANGNKAFDYKYNIQSFCGTAWYANPIHLENLQF